MSANHPSRASAAWPATAARRSAARGLDLAPNEQLRTAGQPFVTVQIEANERTTPFRWFRFVRFDPSARARRSGY
jgi:hypothetical protein